MRPLPDYLRPLIDDCANDQHKGISLPFIQDDHLCLTNGRVLVRMPGKDWAVPPPNEFAKPNVSLLLTSGILKSPTVEPPSPKIVATEKACDTCGGKRIVRGCLRCFGEGCANCKETGFLRAARRTKYTSTCNQCDPRGVQTTYSPTCFDLGGRWIDSGLWHMIKDFPDLRVMRDIPPESRKRNQYDPIMFTFKGGHGLLMPLGGSDPQKWKGLRR